MDTVGTGLLSIVGRLSPPISEVTECMLKLVEGKQLFPFYRGCPLLRVSIIGLTQAVCIYSLHGIIVGVRLLSEGPLSTLLAHNLQGFSDLCQKELFMPFSK